MQFLSLNALKQRLVFWLGATLIGLIIVFMILVGEISSQLFRQLVQQSPFIIFLIAPSGLVLTAWLTQRFFQGSERSGVPQIKTALENIEVIHERHHLISLRIALGKFLLPMMGLFSGASVGFGGPAVHIGASIMHGLGKAFKFPSGYMSKGLILAGSAAGFAAMFSAPLTGIVFAIEEMGRAMEERISSLVLTAIIFSGITAYAILNTYIYFPDKTLILPWGKSWLAIPLCALAGGLMGALFTKIITTGGTMLEKHNWSMLKTAFIAGLIIAVLGYLADGATYGTGYQETKAILKGEVPADPLYPFYKLLATCATFFSGIPSGIFVPSLAAGAGLGSNLAEWFPLAPATIMILLTMTAYFSGMLRSPITSFVLVMEMTGGNAIVIPLMTAAFIASGISKLINPIPLYRTLSDGYKASNGTPEDLAELANETKN